MSENSLDSIRQKIDAIDHKMHDLLMQRADIVQEIIAAKKESFNTDPTIYRPAREAFVLKSLLSRHQGTLPHSVIIGMWRSLLSAFCAMQCDFSVTYFSYTETENLRDAVHYYFGGTIKILKSETEQDALQKIANQETTLAVLPVNTYDMHNEWWLHIPDNVYVSAIMPYIINDPIMATRNNHMVLSKSKPIATDNDKSLFKISSDPNIGRISIINCFNELSLTAQSLTIYDATDLSQRFHLIEVDGFFSVPDAENLCQALENTAKKHIISANYLGSYPAPILLDDFLPQPDEAL